MRRLLQLILITALLVGGPAKIGAAAKPLAVFVSLPPQADFVQKIGGAHVNVQLPAKGGQDPHTFEPTPRDILALARADIFFTSNLPFEKQLVNKIKDRANGPIIIDIAAGFAEYALHPAPEPATHRHHGHDEQHEEDDPHSWLSPILLVPMAENIHQALVNADPQHKADYDANLSRLITEINTLHDRLKRQLAPFKGRSFYVFHPAFGYFAATYGLKQQAVETGGKSPSPRQLAALISQARADGVKIIFTQPQFDKSSAATIARAINGVVTPMDPLAGDVLANLKQIADAIEQALGHR
ncbi:MAG: zinc ABC transporter substrate-binding protein [Desulfobulbaceae bacterium]|nr:zinc ABC transporter substrate-binding protein [Desulfobulbaceae bacterium]HIJ79054.1 zinc ABC transporter solute-binding protein [Deltaproteobacteria bacterium]